MYKKRIILMALASILVSIATNAKVTRYPVPVNVTPENRFIMPSTRYEVEVTQNEKTMPVFTYMMNAMQYTNRVKTTSWSSFAFDGKVKVRVRMLMGEIGYCAVLPTSKQIEVIKGDDFVEFYIDKPGQYSIEFQQGVVIDHPLLLFADPLETDIPDKQNPNVIWFEPGVHEIGDNFEVKSGQTIYVEAGAYIKGRMVSTDAENIKLLGRGIISGEQFPVRTAGFLVELNGDNIIIDGPTIIHAPSHNVVCRGNNHIARWVKVMGWWFSTDGIHLGNNSMVEDCFTKVNDDAIRLYGINSTARRCVIWQMENGAPFQTGWSGSDRFMTLAYDIDVIRCENYYDNENESIFCSIKGTGGHQRYHMYDDIRIENCDWRIFRIVTMPNRWAEWDPESGSLSDITFRNIKVSGTQKLRNIIKGHDEKHPVYNITFENLEMNGQLVRSAEDGNFFIDPKTTSNIRFIVTKESKE
jgi:hypothetical protein